MYELTRNPGVAQTTEVILLLGIIPTPVSHTSLTSFGVSSCAHIMIQGSSVLARGDIQMASITGGAGPGVASGTNSSKTQPAGASGTYMIGGQGTTRSQIDPHTGNSTNIVPIFQSPSQTIVQVLS
jgi:hypothetical protein